MTHRPRRRLPLTLLLLLPAFSGCFGPTYPKERVAEAVENLCRKEDKLEVSAQLSGHTLYALGVVEGLIGLNLELDPKKMDFLEKILTKLNRVAVSSDADIRFVVVELEDKRLSSQLSVLQNVEDFRAVSGLAISRTDYQDRLVIDINPPPAENAERDRHDVDINEFFARLTASRIKRKFVDNPLLRVVMDVETVEGSMTDGIITLTLKNGKTSADKAVPGEPKSDLKINLVRDAVLETGGDMVSKIDKKGLIRAVIVEEEGKILLEAKRGEILQAAKKPKKR